MTFEFSQEERVFIDFIKAGIWSEEIELPVGFTEWKRVARLAKAQAMYGIVSNEILNRVDDSKGMTNDLRVDLKSFKVSNIMAVNRVNITTAKLFNLLKDKGFSPVLLKGSGLAANYPHPELRQCGDIDVYMGEEDYVKSYDLLIHYASRIDNVKDIWIDKNYSAVFGDVEAEIHRVADEHSSSALDRKLQKFTKEFLRNTTVSVEIAGVPVETPSDTFNAFYVFLHMFRHFMIKGVGMRQVCDWMLFLTKHNTGINQEALKKALNDMHILRAWQDFVAMAVNYLGADSAVMPLYREGIRDRRQKKILKRILTEGNFGKSTAYFNDRSENYLVVKITSLCRHIERYMQLASLYPTLIFPYMSTVFKFGFGRIGRDLKDKFNGR